MSQHDIKQLIDALKNSKLYEHPVNRFEVIETHISWVLLTGDYAYKFKKPVDLGFLDFSSLEKRHRYCLEELRLNSRLAPEIYLGVVKITGTLQTPNIEGDGPALEYAVKMHQFSQQDLLVNRVQAGSMTTDHIDQIALCIARFHARIARADRATDFGTAETVRQPVMENFQQIKQFTGTQYEQALKQLEDWCNQQYSRNFSIFESRKDGGFIRECHGDLHLGNIVIYHQKVLPFDGIEFNENLRWIDIISEVAFLFMDLEYHQHPDLAFRFLNIWLEQTGDYPGLILLRYYLVYRAMVRAKVVSIRLKQQGTSAQKAQRQQEVARYLRLARTYIRNPMPRLMICHGLSGSGKTYVSQKLLETIHAIRIRSDVERKRLFGIAPEKSSGSEINRGIYTDDISHKVYQRLHDLARNILDAGYTVIVDATFLKLQQRMLFKTLATAMNVPYYIIHCHANQATLRQRIIDRKRSEWDASEADLNVLDYQLQHQQYLTEEEREEVIELDTGSDFDLKQFISLRQTKFND